MIAEFRPGRLPLPTSRMAPGGARDRKPRASRADEDESICCARSSRAARARWSNGAAADNLPQGSNLLLLVDQFEELFRYQRLCRARGGGGLRRAAPRERASAARRASTSRSRCAPNISAPAPLIEGLADAINAGLYPDAADDAASSAARRSSGRRAVCDIDIEPALVNRLLNDLASFAPWDDSDAARPARPLMRRADQLPLLQYTLNRMWLRARAADAGERGQAHACRLRGDRRLERRAQCAREPDLRGARRGARAGRRDGCSAR